MSRVVRLRRDMTQRAGDGRRVRRQRQSLTVTSRTAAKSEGTLLITVWACSPHRRYRIFPGRTIMKGKPSIQRASPEPVSFEKRVGSMGQAQPHPGNPGDREDSRNERLQRLQLAAPLRNSKITPSKRMLIRYDEIMPVVGRPSAVSSTRPIRAAHWTPRRKNGKHSGRNSIRSQGSAFGSAITATF